MVSRLLPLALGLSQGGCALLASANAAHSHITPCVRDTGFAVIDLGLAGATTGVLVLTDAIDESPAWMLLPGAFVASGVIGAVSAHRCRSGGHREARTAPSPPYQAPPPALQPALPQATPEELGVLPPDPSSPAVDLQLDPTYLERLRDGADAAEAAASPEGVEDRNDDTRPCDPSVTLDCPRGTTCRMSLDQTVRCVP
ncbi:MAG: hypothetical protein R3B48_17450 [Kofleriaceae bacterium]